MKSCRILIYVLSISFSFFKTNGQQVDNTKPMYGEVEKSAEYKKIDEDFRNDCLLKFRTIDSSVYIQVDYAWRYFYHDDLKTAMKRFNQGWLLNPDNPDSYFGFAALLEMQKNNAEANRFYKIGLAKDKMNQRAKICYKRIADCKEQLNDTAGVIDAYTKLAALSPGNSFAFKKIGYFQMLSGNSDAAIKAYGKAIELDTADASTYNNRAYLYQTQKNYSKAIADYTKSIDLDAEYVSAYLNRGITEMQLNNNLAAKKDFEVCVKLDAKAGGLRKFLALAELSLHDKAGACKDLELAKNLGDEDADKLIIENCK
jgi:tetratricopeptide (TPR) repeat protein